MTGKPLVRSGSLSLIVLEFMIFSFLSTEISLVFTDFILDSRPYYFQLACGAAWNLSEDDRSSSFRIRIGILFLQYDLKPD
jgi:hypothetical protein